jgi:hypothetical protein
VAGKQLVSVLLFIGLIMDLLIMSLFFAMFIGSTHSDLSVAILDPTQQPALFTIMPFYLVVVNHSGHPYHHYQADGQVVA